ncbi:MAG: P-II family nitrogen regulator [Melioribacteraceae bacterium]
MKTIKAYVRTDVTKKVIKKLEEKGVKNMMVERIDEIAQWEDKEARLYSLEYLEKYNVIEKIEFVCEDKDVEILCELIKVNSKTGHDDNGVIIVQPAEKIIPISTKKD